MLGDGGYDEKKAELARLMQEQPELRAKLERLLAGLEEREQRLQERNARLLQGMSRKEREAWEKQSADRMAARKEELARLVAAEPYSLEEQALLEEAKGLGGAAGERKVETAETMRRFRVRERQLEELKGRLEQQSAAQSPIGESREMSARMLTYRLVPLWIFLAVFGLTLIWESGVQGNPITSAKLQAAALTSLFFALIIGAVVGIRFFNPQPPKA